MEFPFLKITLFFANYHIIGFLLTIFFKSTFYGPLYSQKENIPTYPMYTCVYLSNVYIYTHLSINMYYIVHDLT